MNLNPSRTLKLSTIRFLKSHGSYSAGLNFKMHQLIIGLALMVMLASCNSSTNTTNNMQNQSNQTPSKNDTTPRVTGIGGIFFLTENPQEMKEWYTKNLGLEINDWGASSFDSRDINHPDQVNTLQWTPFKQSSDYFAPSKKEFMINYRVQNIEGLIEQFKANGVTILDTLAVYEYGKFIHIMDTQGNKIELWEPANQ